MIKYIDDEASWHINKLKDMLEKLGIHSAAPKTYDEAFTRVAQSIVSFDDSEDHLSGINLDDIMKRVRP